MLLSDGTCLQKKYLQAVFYLKIVLKEQLLRVTMDVKLVKLLPKS